MSVLNVLNEPWGIKPDKLNQIIGIYSNHYLNEDKGSINFETKVSKSAEDGYRYLSIENGVAILDVVGVIAKRMNLFMAMSGGASTELLAKDFKRALEDPSVESILLYVDSPGGTVDGTFEFANQVYAARGKKPIITFTDGMMSSAAYAIGSAADKVFISGDTVDIGSIGVVATHVDVSKMESNLGVKTTEIYAGKYKRIASSYNPLSKEGKAYIQDQVDYLYSVFVKDVARNRGVSEKVALEEMAEARVFIGSRAVDAGLVDGIATLDQLLKDMAEGNVLSTHAKNDSSKLSKENTPMSEQDKKGEMTIDYSLLTADDLKEKRPDLTKAITKKGYDLGHEEGMKKGAEDERERIRGVKAQSMPGHEALIETLIFDGLISPDQAAAQVIRAEKAALGDRANALAKDAPAPVGAVASESVDEADQKDLSQLPIEDRAKAEWDKSPDLRAEFGDSFDRYLAYEKAKDKNGFKALNKGGE